MTYNVSSGMLIPAIPSIMHLYSALRETPLMLCLYDVAARLSTESVCFSWLCVIIFVMKFIITSCARP